MTPSNFQHFCYSGPNRTQPNPWVNATHGQLCFTATVTVRYDISYRSVTMAVNARSSYRKRTLTELNRFKADLVPRSAVGQRYRRQRAHTTGIRTVYRPSFKQLSNDPSVLAVVPQVGPGPDSRRPISVLDQPPTSVQPSIAADGGARILHVRSAFRRRICGCRHVRVVTGHTTRLCSADLQLRLGI